MMKAKKFFLNIWTDGSCSGNPGPGGWSAVFDTVNYVSTNNDDSLNKDILILTGGSKNTTNNEMELTAVLESLKAINKLYNKCIFINMYIDSMYVLNPLKNFSLLEHWNKIGWTSIRNKEIVHKDIWKEIYTILLKIHKYIYFNKVDAHSFYKLNNIADASAKEMTKIFKGS